MEHRATDPRIHGDHRSAEACSISPGVRELVKSSKELLVAFRSEMQKLTKDAEAGDCSEKDLKRLDEIRFRCRKLCKGEGLLDKKTNFNVTFSIRRPASHML